MKRNTILLKCFVLIFKSIFNFDYLLRPTFVASWGKQVCQKLLDSWPASQKKIWMKKLECLVRIKKDTFLLFM